MDKYDDEDILDDTKDDLLLVRKYDRFPGYFSKILNSRDNVLAISRYYTINSYMFITDNIYGITDSETGYDWANRLSLNAVFGSDSKWLTFGSKFQFARLLGCKIEGASVATESPFNAFVSGIDRILFPPVDLALMYHGSGVPSPTMGMNDFANSDTSFRIWGNGDVVSKSYVFPPPLSCGKYTQNRVIFPTSYYLYCGGHYSIPTIDLGGSEAFQICITVYIELKGFDDVQHI